MSALGPTLPSAAPQNPAAIWGTPAVATIGGLDDRPPFADFSLLKVGKRVRRLPLPWKNLLPKLEKSLMNHRVSQGSLPGT
jgi:hypothetical protein